MISIFTHKTQAMYGYDIRLLSTDIKPIDGIPNGSVCIEMDTSKGYLFDAESEEWHEIAAGSAIVINPASGVSF